MITAFRKKISVLLICATCLSFTSVGGYAEEGELNDLQLDKPQMEEVLTGEMLLEESAHEHVYEQSICTEPSCEAEGSIAYFCVCGDSYTETISATGHNYQLTETVESPSAEAGYLVYTCSNCGTSYIDVIETTDTADKKMSFPVVEPATIPAAEKSDPPQDSILQQTTGETTGTDALAIDTIQEDPEKEIIKPVADAEITTGEDPDEDQKIAEKSVNPLSDNNTIEESINSVVPDDQKSNEHDLINIGHDSGQYINPFFKDFLNEDQVTQSEDYQRVPLFASAEYITVDEAALQLYSMLMHRSESFEIQYTYASDVYDTSLNPSYLFNIATAHNGIPNAGDYLTFTLMLFRWEVTYFPKDGSYYLTATFSCLYTDTYEEEMRTGEAVNAILTGLNLNEKSSYEKVKAIYDYLTTNITYDYSYNNYSGYNALVQHHAVCQGIALAFYRLALSAGLDARFVSCRAMNHGWNIVCIDGLYYYLDATWDLGYFPNYRYFLIGRINWQKSHQYGDEFGNGSFNTYSVSDPDYISPLVKEFFVSFNANGGSGAPAEQTKTYGTALTLSSTQPTRAGYTFQGWATSSTGSVAYQPGGSYTAEADATLYAVWRINTFTVNYDANGGNGAPAAQTKTYDEALTLSSTQPTRTGYTFLGWATSSTDSVSYQPGGSYTADADITLFAVWEKATCDGFVERLYSVCLNRPPESEELAYYVEQLSTGETTGVTVASNFIFSPEFKGMNLCNAHYIEYLYRAFFGREADPEGREYWLNMMGRGVKREEIFNLFTVSGEYKTICEEYGILRGEGIDTSGPGTVQTGECTVSGCTTERRVDQFVARLYRICLDREAAASEISWYSDRLLAKQLAGKEAAYGFIFSPEFTGKGYTDREYVIKLYEAFMGREPADTEVSYHADRLKNGAGREDVFNGFAMSNEFLEICESYFINRG